MTVVADVTRSLYLAIENMDWQSVEALIDGRALNYDS